MPAPDLEVTFVPAPDEVTPEKLGEEVSPSPPVKSKYNLTIRGPVSSSSVGDSNQLIGSITQIAAILGPATGTAIGAWLHARYGRKVRIKVGDIEVEAERLAEIERLLAKAQEIQQRNEPKKIHEP